MKDLLYLKDEQIKEFIQLLYYAYRETFSDPKEVLSKKYFGPAPLRALNLIERNQGISLGELIFKLKITKQSLSRVLNQLVKEKYIILSVGDDKRTKKLILSKKGQELEKNLSEIQIKKIRKVLLNFNEIDINGFKKILYEMVEDSNKKKFDEINN